MRQRSSTPLESSIQRQECQLQRVQLHGLDIFSQELVEIGRTREDIVAITAAMLGPTGLDKFQSEFPERTIDVGIAEQHAVTSAAGLAFAWSTPSSCCVFHIP